MLNAKPYKCQPTYAVLYSFLLHLSLPNIWISVTTKRPYLIHAWISYGLLSGIIGWATNQYTECSWWYIGNINDDILGYLYCILARLDLADVQKLI